MKFAPNTFVQRVSDSAVFAILSVSKLKPDGEMCYIYRLVDRSPNGDLTLSSSEIRRVSDMEDGSFAPVVIVP